MSANLQSSKVSANELSSSAKFNNLVQAVEDYLNSLDNSNIAAGAAIAVSKLASGSNGDVLTTVGGATVWAAPGAAAAAPVGAVSAYAGSAAPTGWLLCDGTAVSRTTYVDLFGIVGTTYGVGDGATTFNLPDLRGRVAVGKGTNAAVDTLGENDGVSVANRRPQHRHTPHSHTVTTNNETGFSQHITRQAFTAAANTASSSSDGGSGNVNDALDAPAHIVLNFIVKT